MSTSTKNLNLVKPESTEYFDIGVMNQNMDSIDAAVAACKDDISLLSSTVKEVQSQQASSIADLSAKIDSLVTTCNAIQSRVNSIPTSKTTCSYSATTVNSIKSTVESILTKVNASSSSGSGDAYKLLKAWIGTYMEPYVYNSAYSSSNAVKSDLHRMQRQSLGKAASGSDWLSKNGFS